MNTSLETIPFELPDPGDPLRVLRGVIDSPRGVRESATPQPAVVILHGFKGFFRWGFFPELAHRIAASGFTTVRFNFSGSGIGPDLENFTEDAAFEANSPSRQLEDALRVLRTLGTDETPWIDPNRIGLVGHSMGGAVALLLAGGAAPVRPGAVVTWASVASFDRFDSEQKELFRAQGWLPIPNARTGQVHRIGRGWLDDVESGDASLLPLKACPSVQSPTLLLHGTEDASVSVSEAESLLTALPTGICRLELLEGAGHTFGAKHPLDGIPATLEDAFERTLAHLTEHLR